MQTIKPSSLAAAALLGFGVLWYLQFGKDQMRQKQLESRAMTVAAVQQETIPAEEPLSEALVQMPVEASATTAVLPENMNVPSAEQAPAPNPGNGNGMKQQGLATVTAAVDKKVPEAPVKPAEIAKSPTTAHPLRKDAQASNPQQKTTERATLQPISSISSIPGAVSAPKPEPVAAAPATVTKPQQEEPVTVKAEAEKTAKDEAGDDMLESANTLFASGKYSAALSAYKKQMTTGDRRSRQEACLMAARCYISMGKKSSAIDLLEGLANEGSGAQKRQAKRLLRDLGGEEQATEE